jgi:hypothetical protein
MTVGAALAVTAVVWAVTLIRSVRLRALVYSLPLPMSLVLLGGPGRVDGTQVIGVALLVGFFAVVTAVHARLGGHILLADALGILAYVGVAAAVARVGPIPFLPALAAVCLSWLAVQAGRRLVPGRDAGRAASYTERDTGRQARDGSPAVARPGLAGALGRLVLVCAAALLTVGLGGLLSGLVVTFPYSGVLVAVEARRHLGEFTGHFARTSLALVAFLAGYRLAQDAGTWPGLAAGWAAFSVTAAALHLTGRHPTGRRPTGRRLTRRGRDGPAHPGTGRPRVSGSGPPGS